MTCYIVRSDLYCFRLSLILVKIFRINQEHNNLVPQSTGECHYILGIQRLEQYEFAEHASQKMSYSGFLRQVAASERVR